MDDVFNKALVVLMAVTMVIVGSGMWWMGVVVAVPMVAVFVVAGLVARKG